MKTASHTLALIPAMLRNGHLDLSWSAKDLFLDDSFGSRAKNDTAFLVEMRLGPHHAMTDISIKSSKTISPRKRLNGWFNAKLGLSRATSSVSTDSVTGLSSSRTSLSD